MKQFFRKVIKTAGISVLCAVLLSLGCCTAVRPASTDSETKIAGPKEDPSSSGLVPLQYYADMKQEYIYPYRGFQYVPELIRVSTAELPDVKHQITPVSDDWIGATLHIGTLDVDLTVPEGFYLYKIPGQYWNPEADQYLTLQFVSEYVLTIREVEEETLIQDIRDYLQTAKPRNDFETRGPGYVLYSFRVFHKDYLPIENLFISALADSREYFSFGGYFCSMGVRTRWTASKTDSTGSRVYQNNWDPAYEEEQVSVPAGEEWIVDQWVKALTGSADPTAILSDSLMDAEDSWNGLIIPLIYGNESMFRTGTASYQYIASLPLGESEQESKQVIQMANTRTSVFSQTWWYYYHKALSELEAYPEYYAYPEVRYSFEKSYPSVGSVTIDEQVLENDGKLTVGWYQDQKKDRILRAYIYANRCVVDPVDLRSIMILLHDTEEGETLYGAFLLDSREPYYMTHLEWGKDLLKDADLGFAREYAWDYLR